MKNILKMKIARTMTSGVFWIPIAISYFKYREMNLETAYYFVGFYSLCIVLLEYPTGVIGDYFSHKISLYIGYLLVGLSFLFLGLNGNNLFYGVILFFAALGVSLVSGSDEAVLLNISDDYDNDYRIIKTFSTIYALVSIILGGVMYKVNPSLPFYFSALSFFISFLCVITLRFSSKAKKTKKQKGNIFDKAFESLAFVKNKNVVLFLLVYASLISAFFLSSKWFYNPIFENVGIDESVYGVGVSVLSLCTAFGASISQKFEFDYWIYSVVFLGLICSIGFFAGTMILLFPLALLFLFRGIIETQIEIMLNSKIKDGVRASVISLKNLVARLISAIYVAAAGIGVERIGFKYFFLITGVVFWLVFAANFFFAKDKDNLKV
jgi:MFS family permease